jgi:hypothetical protein
MLFYDLDIAIDYVYSFDIILTFLKASDKRTTITSIATGYIFTTFVFDIVATIPSLILSWDNLDLYWLKLFRLVHYKMLNRPLELFCDYYLSDRSANEKETLISFYSLFSYTLFMGHLLACVWIVLG